MASLTAFTSANQQRFSWHNYAFIRFSIWLALGIGAGLLFYRPIPTWVIAVVWGGMALAGLASAIWSWVKPGATARMTASGLLAVLLIASGYFLYGWKSEEQQRPMLEQIAQAPAFSGTVTEYHRHNGKYSALVSIDQLPGQPLVQPLTARIGGPADSAITWAYGIRLAWTGKLKTLPPAGQRQSYHWYLLSREVYLTGWVPASELTVAAPAPPGLMPWADGIARRLRTEIAELFPDTADAALIDGLLTGNKDALADETQEAFRRTGTAHIMAVSGMHLIFLAGLLKFLFRPLMRRENRWLKAGAQCLILALLWVYGLTTGLAPPVVRALIMYSLWVLSQVTGNQRQGFNFWGLAVFAQLAWQPALLINAGFLLSIVATFGLLLLGPVVEVYTKGKGVIERYLLETAGMTIIATVFVTPLSLLFFGQLPLWFLPANLVLVFLSNICMYAGIGACTLAIIGLPMAWATCLLHWPPWFMIKAVQFFAQLPGATIPLRFSLPEVALAYLLITLIYFTIWRGSRQLLWATALCSLPLCLLSLWATVDEPTPQAAPVKPVARTWFGAAGLVNGQQVVYVHYAYSLKQMADLAPDVLVIDQVPAYAWPLLKRQRPGQLILTQAPDAALADSLRLYFPNHRLEAPALLMHQVRQASAAR